MLYVGQSLIYFMLCPPKLHRPKDNKYCKWTVNSLFIILRKELLKPKPSCLVCGLISVGGLQRQLIDSADHDVVLVLVTHSTKRLMSPSAFPV